MPTLSTKPTTVGTIRRNGRFRVYRIGARGRTVLSRAVYVKIGGAERHTVAGQVCGVVRLYRTPSGAESFGALEYYTANAVAVLVAKGGAK